MSRFLRSRVKLSQSRSEWFLMQKGKISKAWCVYIVVCSDDSYYTGVTNNLRNRIFEHNFSKRGAKYTRCRRPVKLIEFKEVSCKSEAYSLESKIKKLKRNQKINYLKNYIGDKNED